MFSTLAILGDLSDSFELSDVQAGASLISPPTCFLTADSKTNIYMAVVAVTVSSAQDASAATALMLSPQGLADFVSTGGIPCLTFIDVVAVPYGEDAKLSCSSKVGVQGVGHGRAACPTCRCAGRGAWAWGVGRGRAACPTCPIICVIQ